MRLSAFISQNILFHSFVLFLFWLRLSFFLLLVSSCFLPSVGLGVEIGSRVRVGEQEERRLERRGLLWQQPTGPRVAVVAATASSAAFASAALLLLFFSF